MKKIIVFVFSLILCLAPFAGCTTDDADEKSKNVELLSDPNFECGFDVTPTGNGNETGGQRVFDYGGAALGLPYWEVAQHSCKQSFFNGEMIKNKDTYTYTDNLNEDKVSKTLVVNLKTGELSLNLKASNDYTEPRKDRETWPHLLIQQGFLDNRELVLMEKLTLKISFTFTQMDNRMGASYNSYLHSAQFQNYFVIGTSNTKDAGSEMWFGMPFFDYRDADVNGPSGAMDTATNMYISSMGNAAYMTEKAEVGVRVDIVCDIKPHMEIALQNAQEVGFLTSSTIDDLYLVNMNLGWEVPGTFDVGVDIHDFSLEAILKD